MLTFTVQEVAEHRNVSIQSVRNALKAGKFPGAVYEGSKYRGMWQIPYADVVRWQPRKYGARR